MTWFEQFLEEQGLEDAWLVGQALVHQKYYIECYIHDPEGEDHHALAEQLEAMRRGLA